MTNTTFNAKDAIAKSNAYHAAQQQLRLDRAQMWVDTYAIPAIVEACEQGRYSTSGIHILANHYGIIKDILGELGFSTRLDSCCVYISWSDNQAQT